MKKITTIIIALIVAGNVIAQNQSKHEMSVWGAGGLSSFKYSMDAGTNKKGGGGSLGMGYNYFLTDQWSIGTGLELAFYNSKGTFDSYFDAYDSNDGQYDFEFRTTVTNYQEEQNAMFVNVPIMAQLQLPIFAENQFYVAGGIKLGIPVSKKYKITNASMANSGYYPNWSNQQELILDSQEFMGFGKFDRRDIKGDFDLKTACLLSFEAGIKWRLSQALALYTGAYLDYGLNAINNKGSKKLVEYNSETPEEFINNSVMQTAMIDKVTPIALGVKVRMAFSIR